MDDTPNLPPGPRPAPANPAMPPTPDRPAADAPTGRYVANLKLIRCRLADEDRMRPKRRWKLL